MNSKILEHLSANPWITSFQLCDALGFASDREAVRVPLRALEAGGEVIGEGKGKGKRYALASAKPQAKKQEAKRVDTSGIIAAIPPTGARMSDIVAATGLDKADARAALLVLQQEGYITITGNRAGTRYWLDGTAPEKVSASSGGKAPPRSSSGEGREVAKPKPPRTRAKPAKIEEPESVESESQPARQLTAAEAVDVEIGRLKPGRWTVPMDVARDAHNRHGVSQLKANERVYELARDGKLEKRFSLYDLTSKGLEHVGNRLYIRRPEA